MKTRNDQRTDPHRPGAIVPADYEYGCSYSLPGGPGDRGFMDDLNFLRRKVAETGGAWFERWDHVAGRCAICGADFRHGDVWQHTPTGLFLHVGHECANKYSMLADREVWLAWRRGDRQRRAIAIKEQRHKKAREIAEEFARQYRAANPALDAALNVEHPILKDMAAKIVRFGSLSEKQIAFAIRLAGEVTERLRNPEVHVAAPIGRVEFTGLVVSVKEHVSDFGISTKMTVKVTTPGGTWLAWMTKPMHNRVERGDTVTVAATLTAGKDPYFAFGKRPTVKSVASAVAAVDNVVSV